MQVSMMAFLMQVPGRITGLVKDVLRFLSGDHDVFTRDSRKLRKRLFKALDRRNAKIKTYKKVLVKLIVQQQKQIHKIHDSTRQLNQLEELKYQAARETKTQIDRLRSKGWAIDVIRQDPVYTRNVLAFQELHQQVEEHQLRIHAMEEQVHVLVPTIHGHKLRILRLLNEQREMRHEMDEALFDLVTAKAMISAGDEMLKSTGLEGPPELEQLRALRHAARAEARVARDSKSLAVILAEDLPGFDMLVGLE